MKKYKRVTLINHTDKDILLVKGGADEIGYHYNIEVSIQDNGDTLKLFITDKEVDKEIELKESEPKEEEEVIEITEGGKEETSNSFLEVEVKDGKVSIGVDFYTDEGTIVDEYEIENNLRLIQKFIYYLNSDMPNDETINIIEEAFENGRIKELN